MTTARLNYAEHTALRLLRHGRYSFGLDLVDGSEGVLKRGSVYVVMDQLEQRGLVTSETYRDPDYDGERRCGFPRRRFAMTIHGRELFDASPIPDRPPGALRFFLMVAALAAACWYFAANAPQLIWAVRTAFGFES